MTPAWILDIFAALMLAVAGLGACRLIAARPWSRPSAVADIDAAHVLMGVAMAGTLAGALKTLPDGAWAVIFTLVTGWFAWRVAAEARQCREASPASGHHLPHLVHAAAMVYMFAAIRGPSAAGPAMDGMSAMGGSTGSLRLPELGLAFVLIMAGWAVWDLNQLTSAPGGSAARADVPVPPGLQQRIALAAAGSGPLPSQAEAVPATVAELATPSPAIEAPEAAASARQAPVARILLDDRVTVGSRIAMGVTMALMLILMI